MKGCNKCKKGKDESKFSKDKGSNNGLVSNCKECRSHYHLQYRKNNRKKLNQRSREHNEKNKEGIKQQKREYGTFPLDFSSQIKMRKEIELYEKIGQSVNNNIEIKCNYCDGGFEPTKRQIQDRLNAIKGNESDGAENRLYCSETCKQSCSIYYKHGYERGYEPAISREVQPALRKMRFAEDNWICQKCDRPKTELLELGLPLHCHHKEGIQGNPLESADVDECITYCKECHDEVHRKEGCKPSDMRCPPDLKYNS